MIIIIIKTIIVFPALGNRNVITVNLSDFMSCQSIRIWYLSKWWPGLKSGFVQNGKNKFTSDAYVV